ncbi:MAG: PQQ-dependent sugar dehydrogenase [Rubrobacteraceae bacterium]
MSSASVGSFRAGTWLVAVFVVLFAVSCASEPSNEAGPPADEEAESTIMESASTEETTAERTTVEATEEDPVDIEASTLVTGLEAPWDVAFLPDGDALVTERDSGRILRVDETGNVEEVQTITAEGGGEGGLLGVAVSPNYEEDGLVYAYYTSAEDNRIVRFRLGEAPEEILTGIPASGIHNGGRIDFGPDGMLYVGTGDASEGGLSQDPESLGGKILRLTPEGEVPEDNPVEGTPMYSMGHRNVQGLAWDEDGRLYATEFGQNEWDEVNRIEAGENYGWPEVEGEGGEPEYVDPIAVFTTAEASPSGAEILVDGAIPQWEDDFLMAALRGETLWRLELDENGEVAEREALMSGEYGRLRHVEQAPDGSLWVLTNNRDGRGDPREGDDRIIRVGPPE